MNKATKILLKVLFLIILSFNSNSLFAEEMDKEFYYFGIGPSVYGFNDNFEEYLGTERYYPGFYMEIGFGERSQGNNLYIGEEATLYMDISITGNPREKLRNDYRRLLIIGINFRYAFTFGKGNLMDPLFLPFAGPSIGWHWASSIIADDFSSGYESGTDIGFGLFGGFEVKVNKRHKINIILDYKPLIFKTFQAPSYGMSQCGILIAYKLFKRDKLSNYLPSIK